MGFLRFTAKNIRTSFGQSQKIEIDKALTLEHYTRNKVFVSPFFMSLDSIALSINKPGHGQPLSVSNLAIFSLELSAPPYCERRDFACELAGFVLSDVDGFEFIRFFLLAK